MWSDRNVSELLEGAVKEEKKGSLARKEREDKMPTNIYVHGLQQVASGILITAMMGRLPGSGGRRRLQPRLQGGLVL